MYKNFSLNYNKELKYHTSINKKKNNYNYIAKLNEKILKLLSKKLNQIHNVSYDINYWRVIVGPWLYTYLMSNYERWLLCKKIISIKKIRNLNNCQKIIPNINYQDFINKLTISHKYNNYLVSNIIKYILNKKLNNSIENTPRQKIFFKEFFNKIFFYLQIYYFNLFVGMNKNIFLTSFFSKKKILYLKKRFKGYCNFNIFFRFKNFLSKEDFNIHLRKNYSLNINEENYFEKFIKFRLFFDIPISYLEKYKVIRNFIIKKNSKKQNIFSTIEHIEDDILKTWIAEKLFYKSKLFIYDHSGSFRLSFYDCDHEKKISNQIISPLINKNRKFIKLPELRLSYPLKKYKKKDNCKIISIILYEGPRYTGKIASAPSGPANKVQFNHTLNFYKNLRPIIKSHIKFKPPPYTANRFNTALKIDKIFGNQKRFKSRKSLIKIINRSKLIICTYPQTTLLDILLSNKPFIILYPKNLWSFDRESQEILNKLKTKNILFNDPKKATLHVNNKWNKIESWWNSKEIKSIINDLKKKYFNLNLYNNNEWEIFFKKNASKI